MAYLIFKQLARGGAVVAMLAVASLAHGAADGDRAAARRMGYAGVEAYQAGRYPAASEQLEKAYAVLRVPSIGLWSARALARNGKLVEASERYMELGRLELGEGDVKVQKRAQEDAQKELAELNQRVPSVTVTIEGALPPDVVLTLDGITMSSALINESRPLNPGHHVIEGTRGSEHREAWVQVNEGDRGTARLVFHVQVANKPVVKKVEAPSAGAAAAEVDTTTSSWNGSKTAAVALGVVGVAASAFAVVEGVQFNQKSKLSQQYCDVSCAHPDDYQNAIGARNQAKTALTLSVASGVVGGASLVAAGILWFTSGSRGNTSSGSVQVTPWVTPQAVSLGFNGAW